MQSTMMAVLLSPFCFLWPRYIFYFIHHILFIKSYCRITGSGAVSKLLHRHFYIFFILRIAIYWKPHDPVTTTLIFVKFMRTTCLQTLKLILVGENEMNWSRNITLRVLGFKASLLPHLAQQECRFVGIETLSLPSKLAHLGKDILAHPGMLICLSCLGKICPSACANSQPTAKCL